MDTVILTFALTMFLGFAVLALACMYATVATYNDDVAIENACRDDYVLDTLVCMVEWKRAAVKAPAMPAFRTCDYSGDVQAERWAA